LTSDKLTIQQSDKRVTGAVKILLWGSIEVEPASATLTEAELKSKSNPKAPPEIRDIRKQAVKL